MTTFARLEPRRSMCGPRGRSTWVAVTVMVKVSPGGLLRVQLDDQRFVDVRRQVGAVRHGLEDAGELLRVDFAPARNQVHLLRERQRFLHVEVLLRALRQSDAV